MVVYAVLKLLHIFFAVVAARHEHHLR